MTRVIDRIPLRAFHSIRIWVLGPIVMAAVLATVLVTTVSYVLGKQWAESNFESRASAVSKTLNSSSFPLSVPVLKLISRMTGTELRTLSTSEEVVGQTFPMQLTEEAISNEFLAYRFPLKPTYFDFDSASTIEVFFDRNEVRKTSLNAAVLPLATGLSTILVLTTVTLITTNRFVQRLLRLQATVEGIARTEIRRFAGSGPAVDGQIATSSHSSLMNQDEISRLEVSVQMLADRLQHLWSELKRRQSEKLLYQLAGGLAHQLRNSLTGARMAIELHSDECPMKDQESLSVALGQLEQLEGYVRRLLKLGKQTSEAATPLDAASSIWQIQPGLDTIAQHRRVELTWNLPNRQLACAEVSDGQLLSEALFNLILNAIESGTHVRVSATFSEQLQFQVEDDGPGIDEGLIQDLYEPFVSSKPEGLGLGLSLVHRASIALKGKVEWARADGKTTFRLQVATRPIKPALAASVNDEQDK